MQRRRNAMSGIPCAGNGLFLCQEVPRAGLLLAEYTGDIISIYDADHLLAMVRSRRCPGCCSIYLYIVCHLQDKASHVIRIGDSIWCFNSQTSLKNPMQWFVDQVSVAGFANTKPIRHCGRPCFPGLHQTDPFWLRGFRFLQAA
jgi:hypothetical protein